jgi:hypothetical protein
MTVTTDRRWLVGLVALLVLATVPVAAGSVAGAAGPTPAVCDTAGRVRHVTDASGTTQWDVQLAGVCSAQLSGTTLVEVVGSGTSTGAGLCGDDLLLRDLALDVAVRERHPVTGRVTVRNQSWTIPVGTFPAATPFLIGGESSGAGAVSSRIFLRCGASGSPEARAIFTFVG